MNIDFTLYSENSIFLYRLFLVIMQACHLTDGDTFLDSPFAKNPITFVNDHLNPENTLITSELVRKLKNISLESVLFERLDSIRVLHLKNLVNIVILKYLIIFSNILFSLIYIQSVTSLLVYCHLLLQNIEALTNHAYPKC